MLKKGLMYVLMGANGYLEQALLQKILPIDISWEIISTFNTNIKKANNPSVYVEI